MTASIADAHPPVAPEPPRPSIWPERAWPFAKDAAPARVLGVAAGAGLFAALVWRIDAVGIGYPLIGAVVFAAIYAGARRRPDRREIWYLLATMALLVVLAVRAAPWLGSLCAVAAWCTGWLALTGGRTWTGLTLGTFVAWLLPTRLTAWIARGVRRTARTGSDSARAMAVGGITLVLVLVFGALFAGADPVFGRIVERLTPSLYGSQVGSSWFTFAVAAGFVLAGAYLLHDRPRFDEVAPKPGTPARRWEWIVPLAALDLLFGTFVGVQLSVLFGGSRHVLETAGLTYAEYARQGFAQLMTVAVLTLIVLAVAVRKARLDTVRDRTIVRVVLGVLCALSVVIVGSASHRMWTYERAYGFTEQRLFVSTVELWLGLVFVLVAIAGLRVDRRQRWLPTAVVATGVVALLGLAALNPDRFIADRNIDRFAESGKLDLVYLGGLSADAVPALDRLPAAERRCVLAYMANPAPHADAWNTFNLGRHNARAALAEADGWRCAPGS